MEPLISFKSSRLDYLGVSLNNPFKTTIYRGLTAIVGPNGSGKTTLAKIIGRGRNLSLNKIEVAEKGFSVKVIRFTDVHSLTNSKVTYHQQRFESSMNDEVPTVEEYLGTLTESDRWKKLSDLFDLNKLLDKKVNYLSSGETRKLLLVGALIDLIPDMLILDNPYIGLDVAARQLLDRQLKALKADGISIVLLISDLAEIPDFVDFVLPVSSLTLGQSIPVEGAVSDIVRTLSTMFDFEIDVREIPLRKKGSENNAKNEELVSLVDCTVCYGSKTLLEGVNWSIKRGDRWLLSGPNGSGKSTLLSLIHADNPQAYSNEVTLFGKRRGFGETIWDVKKRIGYISSEMHLYFGGGGETVKDIIARGLNDTVGSYTKLTEDHYRIARLWIKLLHLETIEDRRFNTLSDGEQRIVLLARAFVKNPELVILDEPMHGLDSARKQAIKEIVTRIASSTDSTFIFVTHAADEIPFDFPNHLKLGGIE